MLDSFFIAERMHAGWRFWILWVIATNFGFFTGLAVEWAVFQHLNLYIAVPMAGLIQAWILNRHVVIFIPWVVVTAIGWIAGVYAITALLNTMDIDLFSNEIVRTVVIAAGGGAVAGLLQWWPMRHEVSRVGLWWILVSAISWAVFLPGVITGIPLAHYLEYDYRDLEYRPWPPK